VNDFPELHLQGFFIAVAGILLKSPVSPNILKILVVNKHNNRPVTNEIGEIQAFQNGIVDHPFHSQIKMVLTVSNLSLLSANYNLSRQTCPFLGQLCPFWGQFCPSLAATCTYSCRNIGFYVGFANSLKMAHKLLSK